jgi:hypothetical protein
VATGETPRNSNEPSAKEFRFAGMLGYQDPADAARPDTRTPESVWPDCGTVAIVISKGVIGIPA